MSSNNWLSVIVPVYNGQAYLAKALDSVLAQPDEGVEIVVSDNGSTDASQTIIDQYAARGLIIATSGPSRRNWVANSNIAVSVSHGQFVTFLHQDDLWLPGRLNAIRHLVRSQPYKSLWIGPTIFIDSGGRPVGTWKLPFEASTAVVGPADFLEHLLVQNFIGMPTPVFSRAAFQAVGGMDEDLWFTADWDLWLKLGGQDAVGIYSEATTAFRIHRHSQTMQGAAAHASMRTQIETVRSRHISRLGTTASRDAVERAGRFSCEVNVALAALVSRQPVAWRSLLSALAGLGLSGSRRFIRDARLLDRSIPRLRIGLTSGTT